MGFGNVRWLLAELPRLVAADVLAPEAAARLGAHYAPDGGSRRRWVTVGLGVFGAVLIGAGITMLLAHNWQELSRPARAAIALGLLLVAQGLASFAAFRRPDSVTWREGSATGWVFASGAALGLITQTYHIAVAPGEYLALWTLLTLPVVWLVQSRVATVLAWSGAATAALFGHGAIDNTALFWGFTALLLPVMVWLCRRLERERLAALPFWAAAIWLPIVGVSQMFALGDQAWMFYFPALFAGMHALGRGIEPSCHTAWRRPLWLLGGAGTGAIMLVLTFADTWHVGRAWAYGDHPLAWSLTVGTIAISSLLALRQAVVALRERSWTTVVLLSAPLFVGALYAAATSILPVGAAALACSAWLLAVGLLALIEGARKGHIGMANAGMAFIAALTVARFFDADVSLIARGVGFVVMGLAFLSMNVWLLRQRDEVQA